MGITHLWDTNSVIYYLQQQFPPSAEKFIDTLIANSHPSILAITEIELLFWKAATEKDLIILLNFIQDAVVFELDRSIKLKAAALRKLNRLKLPDAIIAVAALVFNLTLLTRNIQDFEHVPDLKITNPWNQ